MKEIILVDNLKRTFFLRSNRVAAVSDDYQYQVEKGEHHPWFEGCRVHLDGGGLIPIALKMESVIGALGYDQSAS